MQCINKLYLFVVVMEIPSGGPDGSRHFEFYLKVPGVNVIHMVVMREVSS